MRPAALAIAVALVSSPVRPSLGEALTDLMQLYEQREYFSLCDQIERPREADAAEVLFLRAACAHAFNQPEESNALIDRALAGASVDDALRLKLLRIERANFFRLYRYESAHAAALAVAALPEALSTDEERTDDSNMVRLLGALRDVPPQTVEARGASTLRLTPSEASGPRLPLRIVGRDRAYLPDTGANLCAMMRSEAEDLGLEVRSAGIDVGTATGEDIEADVAVVPELVIGNLVFRSVVFLVLPDELATIPEANLQIRGIVGFPVFEAMGEIRFHRRGVVEVPDKPSTSGPRNMALDELTVLVRVGYHGRSHVCRLDSGANKTAFYAPFLAKNRSDVESVGTSAVATVAGVGTRREVPVYRLPEIELAVGETTVRLKNVDVYSEPIVEEEEDDLDCNLGQDVLGAFEAYVLDFDGMTFRLVGP
jgi:predicted aspartyl protease